jgi:hypothetical protein
LIKILGSRLFQHHPTTSVAYQLHHNDAHQRIVGAVNI